jgi:hypothetical protein
MIGNINYKNGTISSDKMPTSSYRISTNYFRSDYGKGQTHVNDIITSLSQALKSETMGKNKVSFY